MYVPILPLDDNEYVHVLNEYDFEYFDKFMGNDGVEDGNFYVCRCRSSLMTFTFHPSPILYIDGRRYLISSANQLKDLVHIGSIINS